MNFSSKQIAECTSSKLINPSDQKFQVRQISIDSRSVTRPNETLFVAIKGNRHDGHAFIPELYASGVRSFLVSETDQIEDFEDACFFVCTDVITALQQLAIYHRHQFDFEVLGITGSNGKTTIKEWLFQLLNPERHIVKSPKSYNSQIGVALSVLNMNHAHDLGIFEGGISMMDEMERIAPIIDCSLGIFTNIGSAHDEGFESIEQKITEKTFLFTGARKIICCLDQELVHGKLAEYFSPKLFTWSFQNTSAHVFGKIDGSTLQLFYNHTEGIVDLPFTDASSVENLMHCICVMLTLGYNLKVINRRIQWLQRLALRLELVNGSRGNLIINDCYNADLESFSIALDFMDQHASDRKKSIILSDVHQMNGARKDLYEHIANQLRVKGVSKIICVGPEIKSLKKFLPNNIEASWYNSTDDLINRFEDVDIQNEIVLVKGARKFELERISHLLQSQTHVAQLEIDIDALLTNLSLYQSLLPDGTKTMVMVKAAAYGGGSTEITSLLQYHNIDYVGVAYADEGVELRQKGIQLPILVLNPDWKHLNLLLQYDLEPEIYSLDALEAVLEFQRQNEQKLKVHLKVDSGMNRLGFDVSDIKQIRLLLSEEPLIIKSIFSHLAAGDDPSMDHFTNDQFAKFNRFYKEIADAIDYKPMRHILNSVGILRHPLQSHEMVRLGKGIYGIDLPVKWSEKFQKVHTLKAHISQIKSVDKGATIGYNAKSPITSTKTIATVNIGYADGVFRTAGNGACKFLTGGQLAPTIGNICMDMLMLDITNLKEIQVGDEVEIYGKHLPIEKVAADMQTIPLELLCGISNRVKRIYFQS